jgi:hypothetical protein
METNTEPTLQDHPEGSQETTLETASVKKNRTPLYIAIGVALVVLLAGAAFLAGRLMNQQANAPSGPQMIISGGPGGVGEASGMVSMEIKVIPAPELPQTQPEVNGLFVRRDDNSIYIGTFNGEMGIVASSSSSSGDGPSTSSSGPAFNGPEVEVVITADTKIYHETTELDPMSQPEGEIQQTVAEGSLDELGSDSLIMVWGTRTGDRVVADVILYTQPMIITMPAQK